MVTTYRFENCDGEQFPEVYNSLNEALRECSDYRTYRFRDTVLGEYITHEGGVVTRIQS